jgi:hypothetical protein
MKRVYHRKKTNLEYFTKEGGTRGEILRLRKESHTMIQRGEDLVLKSKS